MDAAGRRAVQVISGRAALSLKQLSADVGNCSSAVNGSLFRQAAGLQNERIGAACC
jgi:hypothetical protein